jgi:hypothetical protein
MLASAQEAYRLPVGWSYNSSCLQAYAYPAEMEDSGKWISIYQDNRPINLELSRLYAHTASSDVDFC